MEKENPSFPAANAITTASMVLNQASVMVIPIETTRRRFTDRYLS